MSRLNKIVALTIGALLTACSANGPDDDTPYDGRIAIGAGIETMDGIVSGRASDAVQASVVTDFSHERPLEAAVWFSGVKDEFRTGPQDDYTHLPAHIEMTFKERSKPAFACYDVANDIYLRYKSSDSADKVYCVGLYPATGWDETSSTVTSHAITGSEDLMFAKQIEGDWSSRFGDGLNFEHLLTWVTVVVLSTSHEAIDQWGDITRLEIVSQPTVSVSLADGRVEFSGYDKNILICDTPMPLYITGHEIATVLCSPKTEYKLQLTTERFGLQTISVPINDPDGNPITDASKLIGKNIVITLYFGNVLVDGRCTLSDWIDEDEELHIYTP